MTSRTRHRRRSGHDALARKDGVRSALRLGATVGATIVVSAALVVASVVGARTLTTAPALAVTSISIDGLERAGADELLRLAGLKRGDNMVALDVAAAERALLTHPWVKHATVRRSFPSKVIVQVVERRAVAVASLGELYLVDEDGVPFKQLRADDAVDLPLISGVDRQALTEGEPTARRALELAVAAIRDFNERPGRPTLSELAVDASGMTAHTVDGPTVVLGRGPLRDSLSRLDRVQAELAARSLSASVIRLDNDARPGWVTVTLKGARSPD